MENNASIIGMILRIFVAIWQVLPVPGSLCLCMHKCKTALLNQPSAAAAERVFFFAKQQF